MKLSRRGWNNVLILGIIAFMVILNLPTIIKNHLLDNEPSQYPYLLDPNADIQKIHFSKWSLLRDNGDWKATKDLDLTPLELAQRWQSLVGTEVSGETYLQIKPQLSKANTVEVWYVNREEPQRITYYQTPKFWLMKSWQNKWIAVSVDRNYLFPGSESH